jgi:hypothetical protein
VGLRIVTRNRAFLLLMASFGLAAGALLALSNVMQQVLAAWNYTEVCCSDDHIHFEFQ